MIENLDIVTLIAVILGVLVLICSSVLVISLVMSAEPNDVVYESEKYFYSPMDNMERHPFPSLHETSSLALSVIVPAYNEEERLPKMLDEALSFLETRQQGDSDSTYEVIVVNDGSRDKTTEVAWVYSVKYGTDKVRVLSLEKNRGKGGAVRQGMLRARGRRLLFADADGATKFSDLVKLESAMSDISTQQESAAVVCGSRAHLEKESIAEVAPHHPIRSLLRTVLMMGFHWLVWLLCVRSVKDTQCGFKLFSRSAAQTLFPLIHIERWAFDVELLHLAERFNIPISEVSVNWKEIEGSKLSPMLASIQMFRDMLRIRLSYMTGVWSSNHRTKRD